MMERMLSSIRHKSKAILSALVAVAVFLAGIPFVPDTAPKPARADTNVSVTPEILRTVYGEQATIKFRYDDLDHETAITLEGPQSGTIHTGFYTKDKEHKITWDGKLNGKAVTDGNYKIWVTPQDEFAQYAKSANLVVANPAPPAPIHLEILPDRNSDTHTLRGVAEKGTIVTVVINYIVRDGYDMKSGSTEYISGIEVTPGRTWSADKPIPDNYFGDFPARPDNQPEDYLGEWQVDLKLNEYEIAQIIAFATRVDDGKTSGNSEMLKVLRFVAPTYNVTWEALAGYYHGADSIESMLESATSIARFNEYESVCSDDECPGWIGKGENILILDAKRAGKILEEEREWFTAEKIANRKDHPVPIKLDPINLATGDFSFFHTNLRVAARMPLEFAITYHSRDMYDGAVGAGWHHTYEWKLERREEGVMYVVTPEGAMYRYEPRGNGRYETPNGTYNTLEQLDNGKYKLTTPQNWEYLFREDGVLLRITNPNGDEAELSYRGTILTGVETDGASLEFTYSTSGKIQRVTDHTGRYVEYEYNPLTHDLTAVTLPDGATIRFGYDDHHRMTEITNPNGTGKLINVYDEEGRVVKQQDFGGGWGEVTYDPEERKTVTVDPLGRVQTFTYDERWRQTSITHPDGTVERFTYDANDNMTSRTDRNGYTTRYEYDAMGNLVQVIDPLGHTTTISYASFNEPEEVIDPLGNKTTFHYDERQNLVAVVDALGQTFAVERDRNGVPVRLVDKNGHAIEIENDADGFAEELIDPLGNKQRMDRDALHRVTRIVDALGHERELRYDPRDRVIAAIDPLGKKETFAYDDDSNLIRYTDKSGAETTFEYDGFDRVTAVTDDQGNTTTFEYDAVGNVIKMEEPNGAETHYEYDTSDRLIQVTDPEGNVTRYEYDGNGNITKIIDPNGGETIIVYDPRNLPVSITDAEGATTTYEYDAAGQLVRETNALGHATVYLYDPLGRLVKKIDPMLFETAFEYDPNGNLVRWIEPNGAEWNLEYDERGLLVEMTDPLGNKTKLNRDELGRVVESRDPSGAKTTYEYDALGRVTTITDALGHQTRFRYDPRDLITQITDANNKTTRYRYDSLGQLTSVTNALGHRTSYSYDEVGNIVKKVDALGRITRYTYDLNSQLIREKNPLDLITRLEYDGNGNLVEIEYPDGTETGYDYDRMNRLTRITYDDGKTVRYLYDPLGRRSEMRDWLGVTRYAYDANDRLVEVTDGLDQTIRYEWTPTGQRSRVIYPDGESVAYVYDLLDRIVEVRDHTGKTTTYEYDERGLVTSRTLPNQAVSQYTYDALGQLLEIRHHAPDGKLKEHLAYDYDPVGNRIRSERKEDLDDDEAEAGEKTDEPNRIINEYTYDALNQLTRVMAWNGQDESTRITTSYVYDRVGNRRSKTTAWGELSVSETYAYDDADRLLRWTSGESYRDYEYDLRGNLVKVTGADVDDDGNSTPYEETFTWGSDNLLAEQLNPKGDLIRFTYDGDGNRMMMDIEVARGPDDRGEGREDQADADSQPKGGKGGGKGKGKGGGGSNPGNGGGNGGNDSNPGNGNGNGNGNGGDKANGSDNGKGNGNGKDGDNGKGIGHQDKCNQVVPPGFIPPGLAKKCGQKPGQGPQDGYEHQYKQKKWEFRFALDITQPYPEVIQAKELDPTLWKQTYMYGAGAERLYMNYLPAYDHDNGWEPLPGSGGAEPGVNAKTLYYISDVLGSPLGVMEEGGHLSARYHYDEFGMALDAKKFDVNWPGPDNLFGYTGLMYDYYTDLTYARARYYKPEMGRFIAEDSYRGDVWNPQSQNLYTYVWNNPLRYVDPSGHRIADSHGNGGWNKQRIEQLMNDVLSGKVDYDSLSASEKAMLKAYDDLLKRQAIKEYWLSDTVTGVATGFTMGVEAVEIAGVIGLSRSMSTPKSAPVKSEPGVAKGTGKLSTRDTLLNAVSNQKLKKAIDQMYRPGATIGDGGLADAIRHELSTGQLVGGKSHIQKGIERVRNLENIIKKENLNPNDLATAQKLLDDLKDALQIK